MNKPGPFKHEFIHCTYRAFIRKNDQKWSEKTNTKTEKPLAIINRMCSREKRTRRVGQITKNLPHRYRKCSQMEIKVKT